MKQVWEGLDVNKKKELRSTIDDQLIKFELEERMELLCSKLRLSKGFVVIKKFCKCTINFMSGILACLREIDNNLCDANTTTTDRQLLFKSAFYKFIEYIQLLSIDQLSHFQQAPEELLAVIKAVSKSVLDMKDCDFYACDQYLVNSIRPHNINTYEYQLQQLIWYCINGSVSFFTSHHFSTNSYPSLPFPLLHFSLPFLLLPLLIIFLFSQLLLRLIEWE